jgi:hypothetical protein
VGCGIEPTSRVEARLIVNALMSVRSLLRELFMAEPLSLKPSPELSQLIGVCNASTNQGAPPTVRAGAPVETENIAAKFPSPLPPEMNLGTSDPRYAEATLNILNCMHEDAIKTNNPSFASQIRNAAWLYGGAIIRRFGG